MNKSFWAIALTFSLVSFQAFSKDCELDSSFDAETLKLLREAKSRPVKGLLSTVSPTEYKVEIMYSPSLGKYVTFLGEIHIKKKKSSKLGKDILGKYDYRLFELVPPKEGDKIGKKVGFMHGLAKVLTFRFKGSTIKDAVNTGTTIWLGEPGKIKVDGADSVAYSQNIQTPADVIAALTDLNSKEKISCANLPLEAGPELQVTLEDSYVIDERNERMSDSLLHYVNNVDQASGHLVIVGMNHVVGLSKLLSDKSDFVRCDNI